MERIRSFFRMRVVLTILVVAFALSIAGERAHAQVDGESETFSISIYAAQPVPPFVPGEELDVGVWSRYDALSSCPGIEYVSMHLQCIALVACHWAWNYEDVVCSIASYDGESAGQYCAFAQWQSEQRCTYLERPKG